MDDGFARAQIEADEREIISNREREWWDKHKQAWLNRHPEEREQWLRRHRDTRNMPCPAGAAPDLAPKGGFVTIRAATGRGYFVIAADSFATLPKRAQKKLMAYANE